MLKLKQRKIRTQRGETRIWYIKGTCPFTGRPIRESTGTDRESLAQEQLAAYLSRMREESIVGEAAGTALFAEAVAEYLGKKGEARFLSPLLERFGTTKMRDIKDKDLTKLGDDAYPGASAATLVRQLYGPMQAVWNRAVEAQMCQPRKFSKPEVKTKKAVAVTDQWLITLVKAMTTVRQRTCVLFMSFSGARASEVVEVLVRNYDPQRAVVLIEDTKNDEPREVHLPPFVNDAMKLLLENLNAAEVLRTGNPDARVDPEAKIFGYASRWSLTRIIKRACKRAKIKYFSPHKVGRHTFAARFLADGHSLKALQEAGGWKGIGVVAKSYAHLERSKIRAAVANVSTTVGSAGLFPEQEANDGVPKLCYLEGSVPDTFTPATDGLVPQKLKKS